MASNNLLQRPERQELVSNLEIEPTNSTSADELLCHLDQIFLNTIAIDVWKTL